MSKIYICPVCGRDRNEPKRISAEFLFDIGLNSEMVDPGGRELRFGNGDKLRLSDFCNACDNDVISEYYERRMAEERASKVPNKKFEVRGFSWTTEALVIAALMRKLGKTAINVSELDLSEPKGLLIDPIKIELQEKSCES